jgi:hypothetical protein
MATTTNYGWTTPNDTDLVKDGAAAIRTLGSSVDTTTKALNPSTTLGDIEYRSATANTNTRLAIGTTGQVLSVVGGVPAWATSDDANAIQNALLTTTGDTIYASGASTPARLGIGTTGQVLTVAGGVPTWATAAGGSFSGVRCTKGSQSISNGVETVLTFDTETFDEGAYHSVATNTGRLTVPAGKAGYYDIYFNLTWVPNATGQRTVYIWLNGVATAIANINQQGIASIYITPVSSTTYYLAEGDYVQLGVYQASGGALSIDGGTFGMNKVG